MKSVDKNNMSDAMVLCDVYKSEKQAEVYLYVANSDGLSRVPAELLQRFTEPVLTLSFELTADRKLAREDGGKVLKSLNEQGYYLQMPPVILGELGKGKAE